MTLRGYVLSWWTNDPNVHPCPKCGCPLQAPPRRTVASVITEHYEVVHPGVAVIINTPVGAS